MVIEAAKHADLPVLCTLFNEARAKNGGFPKNELGLSGFMQAVEGEQILVARAGRDIAGFASIWEPETFLHHLYVSPRYQRQGVGTKLLDDCINRFGLPMSLKCIEANRGACRFYEALGWRCAAKAEDPEGRYILYVREGKGSHALNHMAEDKNPCPGT